MLLQTVICALATAVACHAIALAPTLLAPESAIFEAKGIHCADGAPSNVTTIELPDGAKVQSWRCKVETPSLEQRDNPELDDIALSERGVNDYNACGAWCPTTCYTPAGRHGPNPNDCSRLVQGMTQGSFTVERGSALSYWLGSCGVTITNRSNYRYLRYCYKDLQVVTNWIAWNCQAPQNAHGGQCKFHNSNYTGSIVVLHA
ncbi:hypothetical protein BKA62DRAFT_368315 [Auriculariales sp. MPI-PUGE-AT-0066]|nr:hypothetical protein BKA62DRAFT_368315 [Auriculariales sp. MPI-PUGE-AT-0066]